jgi:acetylornithine deacetylase
LELRSLPGVDSATALQAIEDCAITLRRDGYGVDFTLLSQYPGLSTDPRSDFARFISRIADKPAALPVSYGTEGGLYAAANIPSVICGPGDIQRAHRPNEFLLGTEMHDCLSFLERLLSEVSTR